MTESGSYLLYDGGCRRCARIAQRAASISDGRLKIADLRDLKYRRLIGQARPRWRFEPTLLTVTAGTPQVATGLRMRFRLLRLLGLRRAVRAAMIARQSGVPVIGVGSLGIHPRPIFAEELSQVGCDTPVRLRPGIEWDVAVSDGVVIVTCSTKKVQLPVHVADEVRYMAERGREQFAASAIPGELDQAGRVVLIQELLRAGFLVPG